MNTTFITCFNLQNDWTKTNRNQKSALANSHWHSVLSEHITGTQEEQKRKHWTRPVLGSNPDLEIHSILLTYPWIIFWNTRTSGCSIKVTSNSGFQSRAPANDNAVVYCWWGHQPSTLEKHLEHLQTANRINIWPINTVSRIYTQENWKHIFLQKCSHTCSKQLHRHCSKQWNSSTLSQVKIYTQTSLHFLIAFLPQNRERIDKWWQVPFINVIQVSLIILVLITAIINKKFHCNYDVLSKNPLKR